MPLPSLFDSFMGGRGKAASATAAAPAAAAAATPAPAPAAAAPYYYAQSAAAVPPAQQFPAFQPPLPLMPSGAAVTQPPLGPGVGSGSGQQPPPTTKGLSLRERMKKMQEGGK